jgi:ABC transport system ATP-binding/permease protein
LKLSFFFGAGAAPAPKKKLSFKEQRELQALPELIEVLEKEQVAIAGELADGSLYARDPDRASELGARNARIEQELMQALERWEQLGA